MTNEPGMVRSRMRLVPYDSSWRDWFARESERIDSALGPLASRIEHIGSTAVPDLLAKPIIDIGVVVGDTRDFERCIEPVEGLGYRYRGQHGDDPLRRYFVLERDDARIAQLHVWADRSPSWRLAVAFRDVLRTRADLRDAYSLEKQRIAEAVGWDKSEYSVRKGPFIEAVLADEGFA